MTDVFPRRNLPPEAEEWGREVENRIYQAENGYDVSSQNLAGLDRSSSSTLDNLALQIQQVQRIVNLIPVARQSRNNSSGFAVPTAGAWNTVISTSVSFSEAGTFSLAAIASGQLVQGSGSLLDASYRLVTSTGATSPTIPGSYAFSGGNSVNNFQANSGWTVPVSAGSNFSVTLQCNPASGWPGGTGSYAVITLYGTFTRG